MLLEEKTERVFYFFDPYQNLTKYMSEGSKDYSKYIYAMENLY